jgi:hypothetical protein
VTNVAQGQTIHCDGDRAGNKEGNVGRSREVVGVQQSQTTKAALGGTQETIILLKLAHQ